MIGKPKWTKKINLKVKFTQYIFCQNVEKRKFETIEPILAITAEDDKKINNRVISDNEPTIDSKPKMDQVFKSEGQFQGVKSYSCKMLKLVIYCNLHNKLKEKHLHFQK